MPFKYLLSFLILLACGRSHPTPENAFPGFEYRDIPIQPASKPVAPALQEEPTGTFVFQSVSPLPPAARLCVVPALVIEPSQTSFSGPMLSVDFNKDGPAQIDLKPGVYRLLSPYMKVDSQGYRLRFVDPRYRWNSNFWIEASQRRVFQVKPDETPF